MCAVAPSPRYHVQPRPYPRISYDGSILGGSNGELGVAGLRGWPAERHATDPGT